MALIEGFRVQNYRALKDVRLGRLLDQQDAAPLTPLVAVIGKNGVGKSTLFDAFGFLADTLEKGVEEACDMRGRGGFSRLVSAGDADVIRFELYYREGLGDQPISYDIDVGRDANGRPYVAHERLRQHHFGQSITENDTFLRMMGGKGIAFAGDNGLAINDGADVEKWPFTPDPSQLYVDLMDTRVLAISTLGILKEHHRIALFRKFLQGWYLSYFTPSAARGLPIAGPQKHLNGLGDNLGNVVQYMQREHPERFRSILDRISRKIPGIERIDTKQTEDGRLLLRFNDRGFQDPFFSQQMSDGTLKLFAYYLLLEDPEPAPFICIEEPENGLYPKVLEDLAAEFRAHATGLDNTPQILVTTHQPYFVDALRPEETWILEKGSDGFSTVRRASDDPAIGHLVNEDFGLGSLWYSDYLEPK